MNTAHETNPPWETEDRQGSKDVRPEAEGPSAGPEAGTGEGRDLLKEALEEQGFQMIAPEKSRRYVFVRDGEHHSVEVQDIIASSVTEDGSCRLAQSSGEISIVPPGWIVCQVIPEDAGF